MTALYREGALSIPGYESHSPVALSDFYRLVSGYVPPVCYPDRLIGETPLLQLEEEKQGTKKNTHTHVPK